MKPKTLMLRFIFVVGLFLILGLPLAGLMFVWRELIVSASAGGPAAGVAILALTTPIWFMARAAGGTGKQPTLAERRLTKHIAGWALAYAAIALLMGRVIDLRTLPHWAMVMAAPLSALPTGGVIIALLCYFTDETDEFIRVQMMRALLATTGVTFFLLTAWGFLELYVGVPHFHAVLIVPIFSIVFVPASMWVRRRYA